MIAMISVTHSGSFKNIESFFNRILYKEYYDILAKYGELGVDALSSATPVDTGKTAGSWYYENKITRSSFTITWKNDNLADRIPIAILIQYGHATKDGGYVQGRDFINPAIRPLFDEMSEAIWAEVVKV